MGGEPKKAIVLLSGGLDSATTLAIAKAQGFETYALSFRYGQRHKVELEAAERVAKAFGTTQHTVVDIDLRRFGGSALTADIPVPKDRSLTEMAGGIPITYVPRAEHHLPVLRVGLGGGPSLHRHLHRGECSGLQRGIPTADPSSSSRSS